ncbi:cellulose binding domain-containing protein [Streptosporangium sp. NPDC051022]|uniref:cellulose binding domain-containing protein n=1 Tax=Streptosporangium sp. NPDC051022 TaxID=3155752 RepID=UPI00342F79AA
MRSLRILAAAAIAASGVLLATTPAQAAGVTATFTKTSSWGSAFEGKYTIKNDSGAALSNWKVEFDLPAGGNVSSAWDATLTKSGTHFTLSNVGWNGSVPAGSSVSFGFIASPAAGTPSNCKVNGADCGGGPVEQVPGTPGNPTVATTTDSAISLSWGASSGTVTGYRVYEGSTVKATVTGTSATISGLGTCEGHTYTVKAYNAQGESTASAAVTGTTTGCTTGVPGTPGVPLVTGSTDSAISLSWGASSGTVTGYRVYEGSTVKATVTGTSATISGLGTCETHSYTVKAYNAQGESAASGSVAGKTTGCTNPDPAKMPGAPYYYTGWGNPPSVSTVMNATGIKSFTMAFILAQNGCNPAWDGQRPLTGGADQTAINAVKAAGGSVQISFGGWSGNKLGPNCSTPQAFAGAVQKVIDAVGPAVVDFDIENTDEFENYTVQDRILNGLKIVKAANPNVKVVVTFGTATTGPTSHGVRLINQAKALSVPIDNYTIMPFDFSGGANMYQSTVNAAEGLKNALKSANGWTDAQAYAHMGISGMNGLSDQQEVTSPATWQQITDYAKSKGLTRLAFWSVNRDRPCPGGGVQENCSGVAQADWEFTKITAGF